MAHNDKSEQQRRAAFQAAYVEAEAVWRFLRDRPQGVTAGDVLAGVVRMLRNRATVWELQDELELAGECGAIADILEGQCFAAERTGVPQRRRRSA
jgi:hypothetical protein